MNKRLQSTLKRYIPSAMITLIFLALFFSFFWSLTHYWQSVLQPRLHQAAETHANMLANAQAGSIAEALSDPDPERRQRALQQAVHTMLLVTDPAISGPFIRGLSIQVDYDLTPAPAGSLDLELGDVSCMDCFTVQVPVLNRNDQLLAIAQFEITDAYYRQLNSDLQSKLLAESSLAVGLLILVWITMLVLYGRLHRANELIVTSDRAKTRFMANVSHELRTPLNAILGYTQLYKKDNALMQNYRRGIETIDRSAQHLLQMINDILDFSKMDSENIELQPRNITLLEFLDTLTEMTQIRARLKDIEFLHEFSSQLPAQVQVDDKRLRQVLLNLLSNAVKFTPRGQVIFRVQQVASRKSEQTNNVRLRFEVCDSGVGIPKEKQQEIFLPFHQLDNGLGGAEGSGLGLTISASLVARMGGQLKVESSEANGSRFWFELTVPVTCFEQQPLPSPRRIVGYQGRKRRILSIDDNAYNRDVIRQQLSQFGFAVVDAENGREGLDLLRQHDFDIVLLDVLMPQMNGFEVVSRIRSTEKGQSLPVLALTADVQTKTEEKARVCGFTDILTKPVPEEKLLQALADHLGLEWEYEQHQAQPFTLKNQTLTFPEAEKIKQLIDCAERHDVLKLRSMLRDLEQDKRYAAFIESVSPLVNAYQFRKLIDALEAMQKA